MASATEGYVKGPVAAAYLGFRSVHPVRRLAERGLVARKLIPGTHPRYSIRDLVRIAAQAVGPVQTRGPE